MTTTLNDINQTIIDLRSSNTKQSTIDSIVKRMREINARANISNRKVIVDKVKTKAKRSAQYIKVAKRTSALHAFAHILFDKACYTRKQCIDLCLKHFDTKYSLSAITTMLTDVKNLKYYQRYVDTLVIADTQTKILHYTNKSAISFQQIQAQKNQIQINAAA
ncbi:hypothetical protein LCGC14_1048060 [marine sediment metagenome]|uniref:Uncharacterized protein n=1 Tax=marine sediment metagenome TaxID=412755 RepID=A0A0F9MPP6_9ZZZZ